MTDPSAAQGGLVDTIGEAIDALAAIVFAEVELFGTPIGLIVLWLAIPMVFFTLWFGFINLRGLGHAFSILRGRVSEREGHGEMTQFQALSTALSGTVGLGNIAGVAIALGTGGPGAAFWMFVIGWFAMSLKFTEVTLGLKYREIDPNGTVRGGPMYSIKNGLASKGWPKLGLILGGMWAFFAIFGGLPMLQVNQSFEQTAGVFGFDRSAQSGLIYGLVLAALVAAVIVGGARRLGKVTAAIVPAMGVVYLCGLLIILALGYDRIPAAISLIVTDAFSGEAMAGGAIGAFVIGMRRAVFSTEAGLGSAVIAHSQAKTDEPVSEGMVALIEPFIDTVVICSLGALAMVVAGTWSDPNLEGIAITSAAFEQVAWWFPWILAVAVFLFAFSTLCAWGFYGQQAWTYLLGGSTFSVWAFRFFYLGAMPLAAVLTVDQVVNFVDSSFFLMAIPNVIALYIFAPELRAMVRDYWQRKVKAD